MSVKTVYMSKVGRDYKISEHFKLKEMACKDGSDKVLYSTELMTLLERLRTYGGFTITINSGYRTPAYNKKIGGASRSQHTKGTAADIVVKKKGVIVGAKKVCCICQKLGFAGIGYISENATHVDVRSDGIYRGDERNGYDGNVGGNFFTYFGIKDSEIESMRVSDNSKDIRISVKAWQKSAIEDGYNFPSGADGKWGDECDTVAKKALCYCRSDGNYRNKNLAKIIQKAIGFTGDDIDGKFGSATERALCDWQVKHGLNPDGVAGYRTWKAILRV